MLKPALAGEGRGYSVGVVCFIAVLRSQGHGPYEEIFGSDHLVFGLMMLRVVFDL